MTGLANIAERPKRRPAATPRTAARKAGVPRERSHNSSPATQTLIATTAITRSRVAAVFTPSSGSPTSTKSASPTTTTSAPATCRRTTFCCVSQYPSGSAHTIVVTSSGWMTTSLPRS